MRMFVAAAIVLASSFVGSVAQSQQGGSSVVQACAAEGRRQNLAGQPLADFLTRCVNTRTAMPGNLTQRCEDEARRRVLAGEDLVAFMKKCNAGEVPLPPVTGGTPSCEDQASQLSGDAKAQFVRNCQARKG